MIASVFRYFEVNYLQEHGTISCFQKLSKHELIYEVLVKKHGLSKIPKCQN